MSLSLYMYIYIYIHTYIHTYVYTHMHVIRRPARPRLSGRRVRRVAAGPRVPSLALLLYVYYY